MENKTIRYCPKCGDIDTLHLKNDNNCMYCQTSYKETEFMTLESKEHGEIKPEIRKAIFEKYIKDNPMYSEETAKRREEQERQNRLNMPSSSSYKAKEKNVPKCPTCGSTNVCKISTGKKATGFILAGVFSSNFGKSYECRNCKYKW